MTFNDWHVYCRAPNLTIVGEIDDYINLEMIPAWNDIGTWTMTIDSDALMVQYLMTPGYGIVVQRDGEILFSGPTKTMKFTVNSNSSQITLDGWDDNVLLQDRNAMPQPNSTSPPYSVSEFDTRTGSCSTVLRAYVDNNLGPSAITNRRVPGLTIGPDPVVGATVTGKARYDNLITFMQALALAAGIGFRIIQVGTGLQFQTFAPVDRSASVKFSIDLGNLTSFEYSTTRPTGNYVFVGGDGTGTAQVINEFGNNDSIASWNRIEGKYVSSIGADGSLTVQQDGQNALIIDQEQLALALTPVDTPTCLYGVHYFLGDTVTVQLSESIRTPYGVAGQVVDDIQSVDIKLSSGSGVTTTPTVSPVPKGSMTSLFREFRRIRNRLTALETRKGIGL